MRRYLYRMLLAAMLLNPFAASNVVAAEQDDAAQTQGKTAAPQKCLEALVSPVSGHAECIRPPGAPVEQPRPEDVPCPPHAAESDWKGRNCTNDTTSKVEAPK